MTRVNNNTTSTTFFDERFTTLRLSSGVPFRNVLPARWWHSSCIHEYASFALWLATKAPCSLCYMPSTLCLYIMNTGYCSFSLDRTAGRGWNTFAPVVVIFHCRFSLGSGHNLSLMSRFCRICFRFTQNGWLSGPLGFMLDFFFAITRSY